MRLSKAILLAVIGILGCLPLCAQTDNVTFSNQDGMFKGTTSGGVTTLSLSSSELIGISGFTGSFSGYDATGSNLGTLSLMTGSLTSGSLTGSAVFGAGGNFTVSSTVNGGFTLSGMFSSASWTCLTGCSTPKATGTWQFVGDVMNATLTINGQTYNVPEALTIHLTTVGGGYSLSSGIYTFKDSGGTTNFNVHVTPEPNTLALFGGGLLVLGFLARYDFLRRFSKSKS